VLIASTARTMRSQMAVCRFGISIRVLNVIKFRNSKFGPGAIQMTINFTFAEASAHASIGILVE
jgi:hypothetical protein